VGKEDSLHLVEKLENKENLLLSVVSPHLVVEEVVEEDLAHLVDLAVVEPNMEVLPLDLLEVKLHPQIILRIRILVVQEVNQTVLVEVVVLVDLVLLDIMDTVDLVV